MTVRRNAVVATDLEVAYGGRRMFGPVDLRIREGQAVAVIGPSGAGKTTLLRVLGGLLVPTRGTVELFGTGLAELRGTSRLPRLVGMMQQRLDLIPQLAVKHNVQAGALGRWGLLRSLAALMLPLEDPAARKAVERVGLTSQLHRRVATLSGGEQQRVAFARLLVQDPELILADEPVSSLDPGRADDLVGLLREVIAERRRTLVCTLHIPELAVRHFDRIIGLSAGAVVFDRPADHVDRTVLAELYGGEPAPGMPAQQAIRR